MSTIVAVQKNGRTAIAWDSMTGHGSRRCVNKVSPPKVHEVGASYVGVAGLVAYGNVLEHFLHEKEPPVLDSERAVFDFFVTFWKALHEDYHMVNDQPDSDNPSPFADFDADFLIADASGIYLVGGILSVSRYEKYCSIGSGSDHAEGALTVLYDIEEDAAVIARRAVESALIYDANSGGEIGVYTIQ